jgi:hypothetical protein
MADARMSNRLSQSLLPEHPYGEAVRERVDDEKWARTYAVIGSASRIFWVPFTWWR